MKKIDFSKYSSIKIGPVCEIKEIDEIKSKNEQFFIIGGANNLLISDNPPKLAKLSKKFDYIHEREGLIHIGAATPSGKILSFCRKRDIGGFEMLQKLPGLLGGIVKMNAGLKEHEIFNHLVSIKTVDGYIKKESISYGYRRTDIEHIIYEAVFEYKKGFDKKLFEWFETIRANQPNLPSAGSCFKNPEGDFAGRLLQECGLKGFRVGGVGFSKKHANFLVNYGNGTFEEAVQAIDTAKKEVKSRFDIELELEIKVVGH